MWLNYAEYCKQYFGEMPCVMITWWYTAGSIYTREWRELTRCNKQGNRACPRRTESGSRWYTPSLPSESLVSPQFTFSWALICASSCTAAPQVGTSSHIQSIPTSINNWLLHYLALKFSLFIWLAWLKLVGKEHVLLYSSWTRFLKSEKITHIYLFRILSFSMCQQQQPGRRIRIVNTNWQYWSHQSRSTGRKLLPNI